VDLNDAHKLWYNSQSIEGVFFGLNDSVLINSGKHKGEWASVISLSSLIPVTYLVELGSGSGDIEVAQSELERDETR
jgi:hypothetical protein